MPFPYVFTFYRYKGGVGRSLAVMNVAYTLAGWARHVLMVDMDLEAPGISGFLQRSNELAEPGSAHPKDILTLLGEAVRALRNGGEADEMQRSLPPLSNYIRAVAEEKLAALRPQLGLLGHLDVLGTDQSRDYNARLAQLDLQALPQDRLIALSRLLHQYLKAQVFPHRPLGVEDFEPPIQTPYDYVLVDSRTGITEIGGLCVGPLADRLVVVTALNDQNVSGTLSFLEEAGIQPKSRSEKDPPWDDADTVSVGVADSPSLGPKPTIVVASPVPAGEIAYKRQRLSELEKLLGIHPVSLSYHPQMALMESVFVRDYPEEYLAQEYNPAGDESDGASWRRSAAPRVRGRDTLEREEGSGQGHRLRVADRLTRSENRCLPTSTVLAEQPTVRYSGDAATVRSPLPGCGNKAVHLQQLGQRADRPRQDQGGG